MRLKLIKTIVPWKLTAELRAAGVDLLRDVAVMMSGDGLYIPLVDESQAAELLTTIEATIDTHDGVDDRAVKLADAQRRIQNIPGWATWDEATALEWGDTNIGTPLENGRANLPATLTLASARLVILAIIDILDAMWVLQRALIRLSVAYRDRILPDLDKE